MRAIKKIGDGAPAVASPPRLATASDSGTQDSRKRDSAVEKSDDRSREMRTRDGDGRTDTTRPMDRQGGPRYQYVLCRGGC